MDDHTDNDRSFSNAYYWIDCADGMVPILSGRIKKLVSEMPILEYLLLGHPNMKPKVLETNPSDLAQILNIPADLQISKAVFVRLVHIVLEHEDDDDDDQGNGILLDCNDQDALDDLARAVVSLGGCAKIEKRIHQAQRKVRNPLTLADDVKEEFRWLVAREGTEYMKTAMDSGYSYVYTDSSSCLKTYIYRKRKREEEDNVETDASQNWWSWLKKYRGGWKA